MFKRKSDSALKFARTNNLKRHGIVLHWPSFHRLKTLPEGFGGSASAFLYGLFSWQVAYRTLALSSFWNNINNVSSGKPIKCTMDGWALLMIVSQNGCSFFKTLQRVKVFVEIGLRHHGQAVVDVKAWWEASRWRNAAELCWNLRTWGSHRLYSKLTSQCEIGTLYSSVRVVCRVVSLSNFLTCPSASLLISNYNIKGTQTDMHKHGWSGRIIGA